MGLNPPARGTSAETGPAPAAAPRPPAAVSPPRTQAGRPRRSACRKTRRTTRRRSSGRVRRRPRPLMPATWRRRWCTPTSSTRSRRPAATSGLALRTVLVAAAAGGDRRRGPRRACPWTTCRRGSTGRSPGGRARGYRERRAPALRRPGDAWRMRVVVARLDPRRVATLARGRRRQDERWTVGGRPGHRRWLAVKHGASSRNAALGLGRDRRTALALAAVARRSPAPSLDGCGRRVRCGARLGRRPGAARRGAGGVRAIQGAAGEMGCRPRRCCGPGLGVAVDHRDARLRARHVAGWACRRLHSHDSTRSVPGSATAVRVHLAEMARAMRALGCR